MIITFRAEDLRNPWESAKTLVREEDAAHCDGTVCGQVFTDSETGDLVEPDPHHHMVVSGEEPKAAPRYYPIP